MARQLRIDYPGAVHHVMARGNARQEIFLDDDDRRDFLSSLSDVGGRLDWNLWAYCLMPNHYHLLIQTNQRNLSRGMRDLNCSYSMAFNRRHERVGHLFQGRFKSVLVEKDGHLPELLRYISLNPVRSGICCRPEDWPWSSYRGAIGMAVPLPLFSAAKLQAFGATAEQARPKFIEFVRAGLTNTARLHFRVPTIAGSDTFVEGLQDLVPHPSAEVPKRERALKPLATYRQESSSRNEAIKAAYASGHYTQAEIARHFGLHYTTVCRIVGNSSCRNAKKQDATPNG